MTNPHDRFVRSSPTVAAMRTGLYFFFVLATPVLFFVLGRISYVVVSEDAIWKLFIESGYTLEWHAAELFCFVYHPMTSLFAAALALLSLTLFFSDSARKRQ